VWARKVSGDFKTIEALGRFYTLRTQAVGQESTRALEAIGNWRRMMWQTEGSDVCE
jgi:hypothetical protein